MTNLTENTKQHEGKTISHFEDGNGNKLSDLNTCEDLVIVFEDGTKILLCPDQYGADCYISQRELKDSS